MMPLGPFYYNTNYWGAPVSFQNSAIKIPEEGLPPGEIIMLSGQTSPSQLRGQTKDVIFYDEVQAFPKESRYDDSLESMGGKKIENPCREIPIQVNPSIQIADIKRRRFDMIDRAVQKARAEIQTQEDQIAFDYIDNPNEYIANAAKRYDELTASVKANEIMHQETKEAEKLIIQNPDYTVVKRNENVQEIYQPHWDMKDLVLPKDRQIAEEPVTPSIYQSTIATENLELPKSLKDKRAAVESTEDLKLGEPGIIKSGQEYVLTFDPVKSEWISKKAEEDPLLRKIATADDGIVNANSIKDALQTLMKYAKILEEGATMQHPVESNTFFEPSYVTNGAEPAAKIKHIAASAEEKRDELFIKAINSEEGKKALAQAMANPIRRNLDYAGIARAAFPIEQMGAASSLTYERSNQTQIMNSTDFNELKQSIDTIEEVIKLQDKKKRRRRRMAPVNPMFLFTLAAAGAGMAQATKQKVYNEDIKVRQINE